MADGGLGLVWLDGRDDARRRRRHAAARGDVRQERTSSCPTRSIDSRVCECCPTSVALAADGPIAAYRNRSAGEIRDIYVTRLAAGRWTMPVPVHRDNFKIEGCPVNGPAIAARGKDVVVAWFTAPNEKNRSYLAFSHDGGKTFGAPIAGRRRGVARPRGGGAAEDGSAIVGWVESASADVEVQDSPRRSRTARGRRPSRWRISPARAIRGMALVRDEVVLAWTESEQESSRVKTARARPVAVRLEPALDVTTLTVGFTPDMRARTLKTRREVLFDEAHGARGRQDTRSSRPWSAAGRPPAGRAPSPASCPSASC